MQMKFPGLFKIYNLKRSATPLLEQFFNLYFQNHSSENSITSIIQAFLTSMLYAIVAFCNCDAIQLPEYFIQEGISTQSSKFFLIVAYIMQSYDPKHSSSLTPMSLILTTRLQFLTKAFQENPGKVKY